MNPREMSRGQSHGDRSAQVSPNSDNAQSIVTVRGQGFRDTRSQATATIS
jgi:hypothetical protein